MIAEVQLVRHQHSAVVAQSLTPDKAQIFVAELEKSGNMSMAADLAGISRNAAYDLRCRDPEFDAACQQALERATDRLERKVRHRAENGSKRGVWYKGELVGHEREHHDTLSMFMLKAHRPELYRPDVAVQVGVGLSLESSAKLSDAELESVVSRQIKRDNIPSVIDALPEHSTVYDKDTDSSYVARSAVQPSAAHGSKGPERSRAGGDRPATRTRKGPKQQHQRASKRRSKIQSKK